MIRKSTFMLGKVLRDFQKLVLRPFIPSNKRNGSLVIRENYWEKPLFAPSMSTNHVGYRFVKEEGGNDYLKLNSIYRCMIRDPSISTNQVPRREEVTNKSLPVYWVKTTYIVFPSDDPRRSFLKGKGENEGREWKTKFVLIRSWTKYLHFVDGTLVLQCLDSYFRL